MSHYDGVHKLICEDNIMTFHSQASLLTSKTDDIPRRNGRMSTRFATERSTE